MSVTLPSAPALGMDTEDGGRMPTMDSGRDEVVDVLRGLCIVMMVCNHVAPGSLLNRFSHAALFIDGAMGFVFLSGYILGIVHFRRVAKIGREGAFLKILRRAGQLYGIHVLLALSLTTWAVVANRLGVVGHDEASFQLLPTVGRILTFQLQPPFLDILPLYCVFLVLAIPGLHLIGCVGVLPVLAASAGIYTWGLIYQTEGSFWGSHFRPSGWQFLFFAGMSLGVVLNRNSSSKRFWRQSLVRPTFVLFLGFLGVSQLARPGLEGLRPSSVETFMGFFNKSSLGLMTVVYFLSAVLPAYSVMGGLYRRGSTWKLLTDPLAELGRASLFSYLAHFVILAVALSVGITKMSWYLQDITAVMALGLIILGSRSRLMRRLIPN